jgi:hypothetical protein
MKKEERLVMLTPTLWIAAGVLLGAAAILFFAASDDWQNWRRATCMPHDCFCEEIRPGPIAQPANTMSSFSFVLVALAILAFARHDESSAIQNVSRAKISLTPANTVVYVFSLLLIGLGSAFFHASLSFVGQFFDLMGMYLLITFVILHNLARFQKLPVLGFAGWYIAFNLLLAVGLIELPEWRRHFFGGLVLAAVPLELWPRQRRRLKPKRIYLALALVMFALAFLIWVLDLTRVICEPRSWLQGHAAWHVLGAGAAGLLFIYFRSEGLEK